MSVECACLSGVDVLPAHLLAVSLIFSSRCKIGESTEKEIVLAELRVNKEVVGREVELSRHTRNGG